MANDADIVASPMTGQLVDISGAPVAGVTVRRSWRFGGVSGEMEAVTDAAGRFAMDGAEARGGLWRLVPGERVGEQTFIADMPEGEVEFLWMSTRGQGLGLETGGPPFAVRCVIGAEPTRDGFHWGTCELNSP